FQTVAGIAAYDATDEQVVYDITKAFWENSDQMSEGWPWAGAVDISFSTAERGLIQFHPGAARYYRQIGVLK
ncbi:MAG: TAXI family TRAP transporter solute-binding subunit, partial [Roseovarius sp.]